MKIFSLIGLGCLLMLTGCASTQLTSPAVTQDPLVTNDASFKSTDALKAPSRKASLSGTALKPIAPAQATSLGVAQLTPPTDLWERMRLGFGMSELDSDLVRDREQWYSARPDYILRMTERSRKYLFHIVEELELRNMPTELALLPFVESAFNPQAVSSAKAAGMWQFMPATGKNFELKQNVFRDDRRDVLASTRAALDYLQKLHGMFGDWELALAAYNWGEGSVGRAIAKNKRAGLGLSYSDLNMPNETRFYVPKLLALKNIISNPEAFNSSLPLIENHPYFQSVDIKRDMDVAVAAKLAEISVADFKALNPSANQPVIFAAGTPQILLPWDNAITFQANLEGFSGKQLASWTVWVTPNTMKAADVAKHVGMSESELLSINNIPPRMLIKAGSSLLVTRSVQLTTDVTERVADNGQLSLAPEIVLNRTVFKAGKKDTVASLAKRYRVSPGSVAEWNQMSASAAFKTGQTVVMFLPGRVKAAASTKMARTPSRESSKITAKVTRKPAGKSTRIAKR
jgi:membrane-bound lytic murein transglycosylase D